MSRVRSPTLLAACSARCRSLGANRAKRRAVKPEAMTSALISVKRRDAGTVGPMSGGSMSPIASPAGVPCNDFATACASGVWSHRPITRCAFARSRPVRISPRSEGVGAASNRSARLSITASSHPSCLESVRSRNRDISDADTSQTALAAVVDNKGGGNS
ncbi:hypothetical protein D3C86_1397550 [compost metagenome]